MSSILDRSGRPTTLAAGDFIGYEPETECVILVRGNDHLHWANGDDKLFVDFIIAHDDLRLLAEIIAQTHGLSVEPGDVVNIPRGFGFRFVATSNTPGD